MRIFIFVFAIVIFGNSVVASIKAAKSADTKAAELICRVTESC
jgi:hypothetical protein